MSRAIHIKPCLSPNAPDDREWWEYTVKCSGSAVKGKLPGTRHQAEKEASAVLDRLNYLSRNHDGYNWGSQFGTSNALREVAHA